MTDKPEPSGKTSENQGPLGLVSEWLGLSSPAPREKEPVRPLYGADGPGSIKPSAVIQGDVNDCFFMAPLAAVADGNKHLISDAIKPNSDGSYTVTFAGAKDKPVNVPPLTQDELKKYAQVGADGAWPAVMEKAFGIYLKNNPAERDKILGHSAGWFLSDPEEYADNGKASMVFKLLTGFEPSGIPLSGRHKADGVKEMLAGAYAEGKHESFTAGIAKDNQVALQMGLHPGHDYTILGYANGMVTLRDPRGKTENNESGVHMPSKDGVFTMKAEDFARAYDEVLQARTKPMFESGAIMMGRMPKFK